MDAETGVVVPMHKDAAGKISFTGVYLSGDGRGLHEHTFDTPDAPRPIQSLLQRGHADRPAEVRAHLNG